MSSTLILKPDSKLMNSINNKFTNNNNNFLNNFKKVNKSKFSENIIEQDNNDDKHDSFNTILNIINYNYNITIKELELFKELYYKLYEINNEIEFDIISKLRITIKFNNLILFMYSKIKNILNPYYNNKIKLYLNIIDEDDKDDKDDIEYNKFLFNLEKINNYIDFSILGLKKNGKRKDNNIKYNKYKKNNDNKIKNISQTKFSKYLLQKDNTKNLKQTKFLKTNKTTFSENLPKQQIDNYSNHYDDNNNDNDNNNYNNNYDNYDYDEFEEIPL